MRGFTRLTWMQAKLFLREPAAFFFTLAFPTLVLLIFGMIFGNEPMARWGTGFGYIDLQVPALAAIIIGSVALIGIPVGTATARESRILRRYRATPLSPLALIAADVVVNFLMSVIGMLFLIVLGKLLFGLRFEGSAMAVAAAFTFAALAFFAAGYLLASLSPTPRVAQSVGMALYFPLMFLSGAALPAQIMPENVRALAAWLPLTHVVKLLQAAWFGNSLLDHGTELAWLLGMLVVGTVLSVRWFRWE